MSRRCCDHRVASSPFTTSATITTPVKVFHPIRRRGSVDVSIDTGSRAAEKLQALIDARAGEADLASLRVQVGRIIEVVRTFIPPRGGPKYRRRCAETPRPDASGSRFRWTVSAWWPSTTPTKTTTDSHGVAIEGVLHQPSLRPALRMTSSLTQTQDTSERRGLALLGPVLHHRLVA